MSDPESGNRKVNTVSFVNQMSVPLQTSANSYNNV